MKRVCGNFKMMFGTPPAEAHAPMDKDDKPEFGDSKELGPARAVLQLCNCCTTASMGTKKQTAKRKHKSKSRPNNETEQCKRNMGN